MTASSPRVLPCTQSAADILVKNSRSSSTTCKDSNACTAGPSKTINVCLVGPWLEIKQTDSHTVVSPMEPLSNCTALYSSDQIGPVLFGLVFALVDLIGSPISTVVPRQKRGREPKIFIQHAESLLSRYNFVRDRRSSNNNVPHEW